MHGPKWTVWQFSTTMETWHVKLHYYYLGTTQKSKWHKRLINGKAFETDLAAENAHIIHTYPILFIIRTFLFQFCYPLMRSTFVHCITWSQTSSNWFSQQKKSKKKKRKKNTRAKINRNVRICGFKSKRTQALLVIVMCGKTHISTMWQSSAKKEVGSL